MTNTPMTSLDLPLPDEAATDALGMWLAAALGPGDVLLLDGPIGAGKTHLARALIRHRLAQVNRVEDVPSPTFTLVQTYDDGAGGIWHADLYRLTSPQDVAELGLEDAFETALCLIEWPDRLGTLTPPGAFRLVLSHAGDGRDARLTGPAHRIAAMGRAP